MIQFDRFLGCSFFTADLVGEGSVSSAYSDRRQYLVYCERKFASVLRSWRFDPMAFVQPSLLEQHKATAEQLARKQRMAALLRRIKQRYAPLRAGAQSRS